jgi:hypothetical protein
VTQFLESCAVAACCLLTLVVIGLMLYVFARVMMLLVQTIAYQQAATAKQYAEDKVVDAVAAQQRRLLGTEPPNPYSDAELRAAAEASRTFHGQAKTGADFLPGYDPPPPSADEAYVGATIDGERPGVADAPMAETRGPYAP